MLEIEIDGKHVEVPQGSTVMDAARIAGIYIPHFCYHKKLSIAANCRMCLVEVSRLKKAMPACAMPVTAGMKVFTHSKIAVDAQKAVMEFLLINHPLDCPICDQGGECQLQDLAVGYGQSASRYREEKRVVFHKDVGPLISMQEMARCIHCTRCVRFGQEIAGIMEFGMANRNMHSEIQTFVGRSVDSELSGNMIDICPVGALTSKPFRYSARNWELSRRRSVSPHDSLGANLTVEVKNNRVMRVLPRENEDVNECWISDRDRFAYEGLSAESRAQKPLVRVDGELRAVEWNVALDYVAHGLKDVAAEHGAAAIGFLASPMATLEELALLRKLAGGLGSPNLDFRPRRRDCSADGKRQGIPWLGLRVSEIAQLDSALVVGSFLRKDHPLLAHRLRQMVREGGCVSLLSVTGDDPLLPLKACAIVAPDRLADELAAVLKAVVALTGAPVPAGLEAVLPGAVAEAIAAALMSGEQRHIFLGNVAEQSAHAGRLHALAAELARLSGAGFGFLGEGANAVGGHVAGALPGAGGLDARAMFAQPRQAYVLHGIEADLDCHDPQQALAALGQAKLVVAVTPYCDERLAAYADAVLPCAPFTETSGTYVNCEGRVQSFTGVVRPLGEARPAWKILRVLGNLLELDGFAYDSSEAVRDEIIPAGSEFVAGLGNRIDGIPLASRAEPGAGLQRIADVPIHFSDPIVRRAPALQKTRDAQPPAARLNAALLARLGLAAGDRVRVRQGAGEAILTVVADETVADDCVRVAAGHPATAGLGEMFGPIDVERA